MKKIVFGIIAAGFLIGISIKYLLEFFFYEYAEFVHLMDGTTYYVAYYKAWYYPVLDFVPVLVIGLCILWLTYRAVYRGFSNEI